MPTQPTPDTEQLLSAVCRGDTAARGQLLERHRLKLRRMVAIRADQLRQARRFPTPTPPRVQGRGEEKPIP